MANGKREAPAALNPFEPEQRESPRKKMGRPSKLTPELTEQIAQLVEDGDPPEVAAGVCGVGRSTYFEWDAKGKLGEEPFFTFRTEVARASDCFASEMRRRVLFGDGKGESFGQAKAALEVISRRDRRWTQRVKHELDDGLKEFLACAERVCGAKDRQDIFIAICEELSRLDSEGEAVEAQVGAAEPIH